MRIAVQKDERVNKIVINKITKDYPQAVKVVLKEDKTMSYKELEDIVFPLIKRTNIDEFSSNLSYIASYAGACFAMFAIAVPQKNNVLAESVILLTNIWLLTFFFSSADNVTNLHKIYQLRRAGSRSKKDEVVYVKDLWKIMSYKLIIKLNIYVQFTRWQTGLLEIFDYVVLSGIFFHQEVKVLL